MQFIGRGPTLFVPHSIPGSWHGAWHAAIQESFVGRVSEVAIWKVEAGMVCTPGQNPSNRDSVK